MPDIKATKVVGGAVRPFSSSGPQGECCPDFYRVHSGWCVAHSLYAREVDGYSGVVLKRPHGVCGTTSHKICPFYTGLTPAWNRVKAKGHGVVYEYTNVVVACGYQERWFALMSGSPDGDVVAREVSYD